MDEFKAQQYSAPALAFLGDSVYSTLVRERLVTRSNTAVKKLHNTSVAYVRAGFQARASELIEPVLTEQEAAVMKRGRNAACGSGSVPKSSNPIEYHKATSLEALFGYLKLSGQDVRMAELFDLIWDNSEELLNDKSV